MKQYRVITTSSGVACLQGRRPILRFLWRTIAVGKEAPLRIVAQRMETLV